MPHPAHRVALVPWDTLKSRERHNCWKKNEENKGISTGTISLRLLSTSTSLFIFKAFEEHQLINPPNSPARWGRITSISQMGKRNILNNYIKPRTDQIARNWAGLLLVSLMHIQVTHIHPQLMPRRAPNQEGAEQMESQRQDRQDSHANTFKSVINSWFHLTVWLEEVLFEAARWRTRRIWKEEEIASSTHLLSNDCDVPHSTAPLQWEFSTNAEDSVSTEGQPP